MKNYIKRTWAEINIDALKSNIEYIKSLLCETKTMAVVKADAYGHGDAETAAVFQAAGVDFFAVSNLDEALSLRRANIRGNILILGYTPPELSELLLQNKITQTVFSEEYAAALSSSCAGFEKPVDVHIKIDTGMSRLGLAPEAGKILPLLELPGLNVTGLFTHLSSADAPTDEPSAEFTRKQIECFSQLAKKLPKLSCHIQNSAGIINAFGGGCDYARPGIILYGLSPDGAFPAKGLTPVMTLKTVVSMVKDIKPGAAVSYSRNFIADKAMRVATLPVGYADGYPRLLSGRGHVLIGGVRCPVLGNVCMDQMIVDVTHIDGVSQGDEVVLFGQQGRESIHVEEISALAGTINYETVCLIGRRVPRIYYENGKLIKVIDYAGGTV
jgi:alanine racemase